MKRYFPVFLNIQERKCLIVGGGQVAARKAAALARAGGRVNVVSPRFCRRLLQLSEKGRVVLHRKPFQAKHLEGTRLAFACTDDRNVNRRVYAAAKRRGVPVNVVDSIQQCDFIVPAVVFRGALAIAISTSGVSPALAREMRLQLQKRYGPGYADFLRLMETSRDRIISAVHQPRQRKRIFQALTSPDFLAQFLRRGKGQSRRFFQKKLTELLSAAQNDDV